MKTWLTPGRWPVARPGLLGKRLCVVAVVGDQLVVGSLLDDPAGFKDDDPIAAADRRDLVRDDHARAAGKMTVQSPLDSRLGFGIQGACAIIQQQHRRTGDDRPGQGQPLALTT